MPQRTISLSVRLSPEEAEQLARIQIGEAKTPSEKLRALISAQNETSTGSVTSTVRELLQPVRIGLDNTKQRSAFLEVMVERLPHLVGYLGEPSISDEVSEEFLTSQEEEVARTFFEIVEQIYLSAAKVEPRERNKGLLKKYIHSLPVAANV
ncbi:hypothetical protein E1162_00970 [Rhodobacteraceae bacterium RKSG542]|uniref:hypothetical protein n=1 Tax=Pseudovibrio flavus TaxID=2529854 RepID=UPI0012BD3297|nr:hypothetical protein [Pseudovibrio flavus]MTI15806.1 hypothetical protein [Pseudovibrio flavus]